MRRRKRMGRNERIKKKEKQIEQRNPGYQRDEIKREILGGGWDTAH